MSFMNKFTMLIGTIVFGWICFEITQWCNTEPMCWVENGAPFDYHWLLYAGVVAILLCAANFALAGVSLDHGSVLDVIIRPTTQEEEDEFRRDVLGDYTAEELRRFEQEDAAVYDENIRAILLLDPNTSDRTATYIDFYGVKRDLLTRERVR